jgi:hypothetical protein
MRWQRIDPAGFCSSAAAAALALPCSRDPRGDRVAQATEVPLSTPYRRYSGSHERPVWGRSGLGRLPEPPTFLSRSVNTEACAVPPGFRFFRTGTCNDPLREQNKNNLHPRRIGPTRCRTSPPICPLPAPRCFRKAKTRNFHRLVLIRFRVCAREGRRK